MTEPEEKPVVALPTPTPLKTETVRGLNQPTFEAVLTYLQTKPFQEVAGLIHALHQSPSVQVTFSNGPSVDPK